MDRVSYEQKKKANEHATALNSFKPDMPPMSAGPVGSEEIAAVLGLKPTTALSLDDELIRLNRLVFIKHANIRFSYKEKEPIISRFCALYLPATFEKFINPPPLPQHLQKEMLINNAYYETLSMVQHSPYFYKYLGSTKPVAKNNAIITKVFARRLADIVPEWDGYFVKPPPERPALYFIQGALVMLDLFEVFLTANIKVLDEEVLPTEFRQRLMPFMMKWSLKYDGEYLGSISNRVLGILVGNGEVNKEKRGIRKWMNGAEECGLRGCGRTENLKACTRCQTVRYCSTAHQKEDWNKVEFRHKDHCYQTEY